MTSYIYKICERRLWQKAETNQCFTGAAIDVADGYIHFSTAGQVKETAAKHFAGQRDLVLIEIDSQMVDIVWEPSRGGDLFPHLYDVLGLAAVTSVWPLPLGDDGLHIFPELR